ncbi:iduronate 2-sulfatase-like [Sycon ciliatum]|uniref:iduronate 2-sulfatase-like n=1 Tax=Sycon ciliatum TaxID=27933 RepID=UPI0031F64B89
MLWAKLVAATLLLTCVCGAAASWKEEGAFDVGLNSKASSKKNVLFIVIDDLRPQLGCYGQKYMHTPNIDKLASESLVFDRAYCQFAFCAPSRNSFMTGRRPDRVKAWNFRDHFREPGIGENWTSLPQYFKKNGYLTLGVGKLFHPGLPPNYDPPSWSEENLPYFNPTPSRFCPGGDSRCELDPKTTNFSDIMVLDTALERMELAAKNASDRPFFLGVGIHKPHLPWKVPPGFQELYPLESIQPPVDGYFPHNAPELAWNDCWKLWNHPFYDTNVTMYSLNTSMSHADVVGLRRGYYAAVSFMDSLVGTVLDRLDKLGLKDNTVVSFHADHGWQLGEHNMWCKMSNYELGTRVPMMIRAPWIEGSAGKRTSALAELVDLYPTLAELAGLPAPTENIQGQSLSKLFTDQTTPVKTAAFSQFPKCGKNWAWMNPCGGRLRTQFDYMGYSIRTADYRYTEWVTWIGSELKGNWSNVVARELYDHKADDGTDLSAFENTNIAASQPAVVQQLSAAVRQQFQNDT